MNRVFNQMDNNFVNEDYGGSETESYDQQLDLKASLMNSERLREI